MGNKDFDKYLIVLNSDQITSNYYKIPACVLNKSIYQRSDTGVPSLISHDMHRPFGWTMPLGIFCEPRLTRSLGVLYRPKTEEGLAQIQRNMRVFICREHYEECKAFKGRFDEIIGKNKMKNVLFLRNECVSIYKQEIAGEYFKEIFDHSDKDGLISLKALGKFKYLGNGVFQIGRMVIFASEYFRRSFSRFNNTNHELLDMLLKIHGKGIEVRISFDRDQLGLPETFSYPLEFEYWWGPKFNDSLSTIQKGLNVHNADDFQRFYHGISSTEFWWQSRDGQHIFEVEELRDHPTSQKNIQQIGEKGKDLELYGCRYIHSIVNEESNEVTHIDGAVRTYDEDSMILRMAENIQSAGRRSDYKKLWRIDYAISVSEWKGLVSHHFKNNPLVGEYLGGGKGQEFPSRVVTLEESRGTSNFIPYSINEGDGVKLCLSYRNRMELAANLNMVNLNSVLLDGKEQGYVDSFSIEIYKILKRYGQQLKLPKDVLFFDFCDLYMCLPLIHHKEASGEQILKTMQGFKALVEWSSKNHCDRILSFNISYPIDNNKDIQFSFFGHESDLNELFCSDCINLPLSSDEVGNWIKKFNLFNSRYKEVGSLHFVANITDEGVFLVKRRSLLPEVPYQPFVSENTKNLDLIFRKTKENRKLLEEMEGKKLQPAFIISYDSADCEGCGENYLSCNCSKILDGVMWSPKSIRIVDAFWTDRHELFHDPKKFDC